MSDDYNKICDDDDDDGGDDGVSVEIGMGAIGASMISRTLVIVKG